jgi:hypothetical protein
MAANTSPDILSHFDRSAAADERRDLPTRDTFWVLKWAAALTVLFASASILIEFAYCLAAENSLRRAAQAGAMEATLPRATLETIAQSIERRLRLQSIPFSRLRLGVDQNGIPVRGVYQPKPGDHLTVAVSVPATAVVPHWLRATRFLRQETQLLAHAESRIPDRKLRISAGD